MIRIVLKLSCGVFFNRLVPNKTLPRSGVVCVRVCVGVPAVYVRVSMGVLVFVCGWFINWIIVSLFHQWSYLCVYEQN